MNLATKEIIVQNHVFILTNQRVVFWEKHHLLMLSDLHIGKTAHFRKNGIPIPDNILQKDLARLRKLVDYFQPEKLIVTGDLLHAGDNKDVDFFCEWKKQLSHIEILLVHGNHDRLSASLSEKLQLNLQEKTFCIDEICFTHQFDDTNPLFQVTGHIHPGILLKSSVKNIKLPGYALTSRQLLLPAFSEFTGLDTKNLPRDNTFYAFTDKEIYEIGDKKS